MQSVRTKAELQQHKTKVGYYYHCYSLGLMLIPATQLADSYSELLE